MRWAQSIRHLSRQRDTFKAFAAACSPFANQTESSRPLTLQLNPRHVADFVRWSGGNPAYWGRQIPPTFFPYWTMPTLIPCLAKRGLAVSRMLNGGCSILQQAPLTLDQTLTVRSSFDSIQLHERFSMVILNSRTLSETETPLLETQVRFLIPTTDHKVTRQLALTEKPFGTIVGELHATATDGRDFAFLTGDINPIHWLKPWAKLFGFRTCIQHGFGTLAKAYEHLIGSQALDRHTLRSDVAFRHPVPLPSRSALYRDKDKIAVWVHGAHKPSLLGTISSSLSPQ